MASSFTFVDDLVRDYLNYRGLTTTSKSFDGELLKIPIGQFRADYIAEQLKLYINQFDIGNLIDYWGQVEQRILLALTIRSQQHANMLSKIRTNLYRCYLIHAVQSSKTDKIYEFFDRLAKILQQSNDWSKEWFSLPFIKNPEDNSGLQVYFSKQWNDLFWISLQNFLSAAFYHMTPPKICLLEDNNSQQCGNLISHQQPTNPKLSLPPSARIDVTMNQFNEVIDEIQISPNAANTEQHRQQTSSTIISKIRNNILPGTKQSISRSKLLSTIKPISIQTSQETTIGNQILPPNDETNVTRVSPLPSPIAMSRPKTKAFIQDDTHFDSNEERLIHLMELKHHTNTVIDCKLHMDGTYYSTIDIQNYVKIWSANDDYDIITTVSPPSTIFQCQAFDIREPLLYLGTSMSTVKVLNINDKCIINEATIDQYYPRVMSIYPHTLQNRIFVSMASSYRSNITDNTQVCSGRVSIVDLSRWSVDRALVDNDDNFVTCMTFHPDRQLLMLGFNDGKVALYDVRANTIIHQKQRHTRYVQDIHYFKDYFYSIGNDNTIIQSSLSSFDQAIQTYELPYSAVGPIETSNSPTNDNNAVTALVQKLIQSMPVLPMNTYGTRNVFDIDPYDSDRLLTCSPTMARFYRLSINDEDSKLQFPFLSNSLQNFDSVASSCVHWNKHKDICMVANMSGTIQLYRRINRVDT